MKRNFMAQNASVSWFTIKRNGKFSGYRFSISVLIASRNTTVFFFQFVVVDAIFGVDIRVIIILVNVQF